MICEDFVMLGKTIPELAKRSGRVMVCSAGYSHEMRRLIRIYPLARHKSPPRWSISEVALERNPDDSRDESWKLRGDRSTGRHERINKCFDQVGIIEPADRSRLIERQISPSIKDLNEKRRSLGILRPRFPPMLTFEENADSPDHPQLKLFDDGDEDIPEGSKRFTYQPYLDFEDDDGRHHLQIRDWGGYEYMRKHGDDHRHDLSNNWRFSRRPCLLVGNMSHQRNVWLVISVLMPIDQIALGFEGEP